MKKNTSMMLILGGFVLVTVTACMHLGTSTSTRFYLLEAMGAAEVISSGKLETAQVSIGVGPVTIPAYLDRPQMVTRVDGNELLVNDFHQWAEPLEANITRVMAENLALSVGVQNVHPHPWARTAAIDLKAAMDVLQFDADADGQVTLSVIWRIVDPETHRQLIEKRATITPPSNGTDAAHVVEAMSAALYSLSQEITAVLRDASYGDPDVLLPDGS